MNLAALPVLQRQCGQCKACCTTHSVEELAKRERETCPHLCDSGCGIYATRPPGCVQFNCLWLQGYFPDEARPDRLGVVFTLPIQEFCSKTLFTVTEAVSGAVNSELARRIINTVAQREVVMVSYQNRQTPPRFFGPKAEAERANHAFVTWVNERVAAFQRQQNAGSQPLMGKE